LRRALIPSAVYASLDEELHAEIAAELNIESVESFSSAGDLVDHSAKANFRNLGKRFGKQTPEVAKVIASADAADLAAQLAAKGTATVEFEGTVELNADDVIISERPREGWSVVNEHGETVALDVHLTPELVRAGVAREIVRTIQEARKTSGLDVSDRITLAWSASDETADALREHAALVSNEVLAVELTESSTPGDGWLVDEGLGLSFQLDRVS